MELLVNAKADCIRTYSGKYLNVFDPDPASICIEDVAHSLSQIPRFGGHLKHHYSVAEHLINCYYLAKSMDIKCLIDIFMHDSPEYALIDVPRPIKRHLANYKETEDSLASVMSMVLGFQFPFPEEVKMIDDTMLNLEWDALMINRDKSIPGFVKQLSIEDTKEHFLFLYNELKNQQP